MENLNPNIRYCSQCNTELVENAGFCSECGSQVSWKNKAVSWGNRLKYKTKVALDQLKIKMDHQISDYLRQMDQGGEVKIGGIAIPEGRKSGVKNAMTSFQDKYLDGDATQEKDYDEWMSNLSQRMEDHNCIVCFTKWTDADLGTIVICPHCQSPAHRNHISDWVKTKKYCPLCREEVDYRDFLILK